MKKEAIKNLGLSLGLEFSHFTDTAVVFDICNGARHVILEGSEKKVLKSLGDSLFVKGRMFQNLEISKLASITTDFKD